MCIKISKSVTKSNLLYVSSHFQMLNNKHVYKYLDIFSKTTSLVGSLDSTVTSTLICWPGDHEFVTLPTRKIDLGSQSSIT